MKTDWVFFGNFLSKNDSWILGDAIKVRHLIGQILSPLQIHIFLVCEGTSLVEWVKHFDVSDIFEHFLKHKVLKICKGSFNAYVDKRR